MPRILNVLIHNVKIKSYGGVETRSKNELCILFYDSYFPIMKKVTSFDLLWKFIISPLTPLYVHIIG